MHLRLRRELQEANKEIAQLKARVRELQEANKEMAQLQAQLLNFMR